jgi:hypothetical protein
MGHSSHQFRVQQGSMAKFMLSLRDENFKILVSEAQDRGITIQELIRAVIIPDWVKEATFTKISDNNPVSNPLRSITSNGTNREPILTSVGRYRS